MNPLIPFLLDKLATEEKKEKRKELRVIKGELKEIAPATKREKYIEELAGRKMTPGQYARYAGIGATVGGLQHVLGSAIEGAQPGKTFRQVAFKPRSLARGATIGAIYSTAIPAAARLADIEAAKRGKF